MLQLVETRFDTSALLARVPLFQELSEEQLDRLAESSRRKRLPRGEMLFHKGDLARGFFLVVFGQVKLAFPSINGNEKVADVIGPGQSFGEAVMLAESPYPVFAEALVDSHLVHIGKDAIFELLENDAAFTRRMLTRLAIDSQSLVNDIESYTLRSSPQRVVDYLLQIPPVDAANSGSGVEIILPTSKQVTASRLNVTPETLSRILHNLADAGLIEMRGKRISIRNIESLRAAVSEMHQDVGCIEKISCRPRSDKRQATVAKAVAGTSRHRLARVPQPFDGQAACELTASW
jgi:CRP-like cAMP-binding protein